MKSLVRELESNFERFREASQEEMLASASKLKGDKRLVAAYKRIASLQAWRSSIIEPETSQSSACFFTEGQNDALTSLVLAQSGSWRHALKSLRSCIENILACAYYKDHSVELELWEAGSHRLAFSEVLTYFQRHPRLERLPVLLTGLDVIKSEYSVLSRAVHASAESFRMSGDGSTRLWIASKAELGKWSTREQRVLANLNLLLLCLFKEKLSGAKHRAVRQTISLAVPRARHASVKSALGVTLYQT